MISSDAGFPIALLPFRRDDRTASTFALVLFRVLEARAWRVEIYRLLTDAFHQRLTSRTPAGGERAGPGAPGIDRYPQRFRYFQLWAHNHPLEGLSFGISPPTTPLV